VEDNQGVLDGEQHGEAGEHVQLDHQDAACPSNGSASFNGENSEDIQNDAVPHDSSELPNELESDAGALLHGEDDDAEAEVASDEVANDEVADDEVDNAGADAETEERAVGEHDDLHDAEPHEPSSEVVDAAHGADVVDAPSPMDVDESQPTDTAKTPPDAGCDDAMEVEYPTTAEDAGAEYTTAAEDSDAECPTATEGAGAEYPTAAEDSDAECPTATEGAGAEYPTAAEDAAAECPTSAEDVGASTVSHLATDTVGNEYDQVTPMAEDADDSCRQDDHRPAETATDLQASENIPDHSAVSDSEYDEVDALPPKVSQQSEGTDNSQEVDESGNNDGLVEGADFTVELQPDTSEQELAASEVDQPVAENEVAEKTGVESESVEAEQSDKMSDDVKTAASDSSSAVLPESSDVVRISS